MHILFNLGAGASGSFYLHMYSSQAEGRGGGPPLSGGQERESDTELRNNAETAGRISREKSADKDTSRQGTLKELRQPLYSWDDCGGSGEVPVFPDFRS